MSLNHIGWKKIFKHACFGFVHTILEFFVLISSIWLALALWVQKPFGFTLTTALIVFWIIFSLTVAGFYAANILVKRQYNMLVYLFCLALGLSWYFGMEARNDRQWHSEVAELLSFEQNGDLVTIHNVRNFEWRTSSDYDVKWETRQYDLSQIKSVDLVLSHFMGKPIAHTLISFGFENGDQLAFSIEIRKEKKESFSLIGGFFRQYELALVAADEKDVIYTRSNVRNEEVYIYPLNLDQAKIKKLFELYLHKSTQLKSEARWYNTLLSNCTTLIFAMMKQVTPEMIIDYRVLLSGYLPNALYEHHELNQKYSLKQWQQIAWINPKTANFTQQQDQSSQAYSQLVRRSMPSQPFPNQQ